MNNNVKQFKGKVVGGAIYAHKDAIKALGSTYEERFEAAASIVGKGIEWNVIKFDQKDQNKLSLLLYEDFTKSEFAEFSDIDFVDAKITIISGVLKMLLNFFRKPPATSLKMKKRTLKCSIL